MEKLLDKIISLAKRRGFIFQSSEIYGGFGSCYDFGPLGVELKNNIKRAWWESMVQTHENIVGLDSSILMAPKVWEASGHLSAGFADELLECKVCHKRFRVDDMQISKSKFLSLREISRGEIISKQIPNSKSPIKNTKCPDCGGELAQPRKFNLMMKTFVGPVENEAAITYLRAETCQGIYMNYENAAQSMRLKIPFGIAQIGKAFRNEINPKDFIYRTREFEQLEMEFFVSPRESDKWFERWKEKRMKWYSDLGMKKENLRFREHKKEELSHYAKRAVDIEYNFPFGWHEIEGIHDRGDWDLSNHSKHSGKDLSYFNEETGERFIPHIIETSGGADRALLAFLIDAYEEIKGGRTTTTEATKEEEIVLRLHKSLAPIKAAVLPLVRNKPELVKRAKEVYELLKSHFMVQYDEQGSIGRRYRRQDEIGAIYCLTCDFQTLEDGTLTIRDRDTMKQERVKINDLVRALNDKLKL